MKLQEVELYQVDVQYIADLPMEWQMLQNKSILISGATGMIGSFLIDVLMKRNMARQMNCTIIAIGRNEQRAKVRFERYWGHPDFHFLQWDINAPIGAWNFEKVHYIVHLASNTHPLAYSTDPIGTIAANVIGTQNLLEAAVTYGAERFCFASSCEVYGESRGDVEFFDELYCGYINCNTLRAGYPESKRCGEALCQAYKKQKNLDIVIPRLARIYGPTMLLSDSKAISQFIKKGIAGENIVLKSAGTQYYSFLYVADAVSGLLKILLEGQNGEAYNVADEASDIMLKDLAGMIAEFSGTKVVFDLPDETEKAGYSTATKARLDGSKLKSCGWYASFDIATGVKHTLEIMKQKV